MSEFTVLQGHRYSCDIDLSGFETWASDNQIIERFQSYGFTDVIVTGSGSVRQGIGTWSNPDITGEIDSHIANIKEILVSTPK